MKQTKSNDAFIKLARALDRVSTKKKARPWFRTITVSGEKHVYTDGCVLITQMSEHPNSYTLLDIDSLESVDGECPPFTRVIPNPTDIVETVDIPKDFYTTAKNFVSVRGRNPARVYVIFTPEGLLVKDDFDDSEVCCPDIRSSMSVTFDYRYLKVLKPAKIGFIDSKRPATISGSYDKGLNDAVGVIMPLNPRFAP